MKLMVINGPNLNFLGIRKPEVYGNTNYEGLIEMIKNHGREIEVVVDTFQSNSEGGIIDCLQKCYHEAYDGIVINPGAYTHYSYAIRDAIESISIPTIEIHISDIHNREGFRKVSVVTDVCAKQVYGEGLNGYLTAMDLAVKLADEK